MSEFSVHKDELMNHASGCYKIVFQGKIYNFFELKEEMKEKGVTFQGDSDEEVILELYKILNKKIVDRLRGAFAFVIWDNCEKKIFAARDPFGMEPLYYTETEDGIVFASAKKSLIQQGVLSDQALHNYLTFQYVPEEQSLMGQVKVLKPGHYLIKELDKEPQIVQYHHLSFRPHPNKSFQLYVKGTRDALEDSVQKHMRGDGLIGAYLSGGIDSTSIVALAKQYQPSIQTFTVGFEREGYNEIELAQETADYLGVENIQKIITPTEVLQELPTIISYMDDPVADPAAIPNYFLAKEARKYVKVLLSGEGADELFGGYNVYREPIALKMFDYFPGFLKRTLHHLAQIFPEGMKGRSYFLRGTTPLSQRYVGNAKIFDEKGKKHFLINYNKDFKFTNVTKALYQSSDQYDATTQMQYIDLHTWLQGDILAVANRMTKPHSLEVRMPFLDKEVYKVARLIPTHAKISNGTTKYVLRQAMKGIIPDSVTDRKKLGFPVPIRHWLKNELYEWVIETIKYSPVDHFLNKQEIRKLLDQHVKGKHDYSRKIWTILIFIVWYEINMERYNRKIIA